MPETAIAFAGAKWVFLVQLSGAEVMVVSMVAVQGRAVVLSVSKSPCCCALCAKKFALRGLMVGVSAKKFALHAYIGPNLAFSGMLGEFFAETRLEGPCWASFLRQSALRTGLVGDVAHEAGCGGGFAALEAGWRRVAGVSYL